jgi:hypothetical protein
MCTVTFLPRRDGYCLGMNRDEKRSRPEGRSPAIRSIHGRRVLYPSEPTGGTWIALTDRGISFALINWYSVPASADGNVVSRGIVIPSMGDVDSTASADRSLSELPLGRMNPFRLVGVFPECREITEWRWDLKQVARKRHRWCARQWISSGFDEPGAQKVRSKTFREALTQKSARTLGWLRRLHRSHLPHPGPFSICMHREDAATVSYTEVCFGRGQSEMRYKCGPACSDSEIPTHNFEGTGPAGH